eukprot:Nk52_evm3s368 gene=Nk52_evmTU3s368
MEEKEGNKTPAEALPSKDDKMDVDEDVEEEIDFEKQVAELLQQVEDFTPAIPDAATRYFLAKAGFTCSDERVIRVISLAAQKFASDVSGDAFYYCKARTPSQKDKSGKVRDKRYVLNLEDLSYALKNSGINIKKPAYYT